MKTRNTKRITNIIAPAEFEAAMQKYALAEIREAAINKNIQEGVDTLLEKYDYERSCIAFDKQLAFDIVHAYCLDNKSELFGRRRSIGTMHGIAGFRLGTPRLKTTRGSNWAKVLKMLKEHLPAYVRTMEEPAKDLLLADRLKEHVAPLLMSIGIQVVQDELFYIETKKAA